MDGHVITIQRRAFPEPRGHECHPGRRLEAISPQSVRPVSEAQVACRQSSQSRRASLMSIGFNTMTLSPSATVPAVFSICFTGGITVTAAAVPRTTFLPSAAALCRSSASSPSMQSGSDMETCRFLSREITDIAWHRPDRHGSGIGKSAFSFSKKMCKTPCFKPSDKNTTKRETMHLRSRQMTGRPPAY